MICALCSFYFFISAEIATRMSVKRSFFENIYVLILGISENNFSSKRFQERVEKLVSIEIWDKCIH